MLFATVLIAASLSMTAVPDTLEAVTVVADRGMVVSMTDTLTISGSETVSDVITRIPALSLSDYGGESGNKSISLRGLGSAHTAIYVDGVRVGNVQSGQADLGFLDMGAFGAAVIDYAQNSVDFKTARPQFHNGPLTGGLSFRGGSFGTYLPSGQLYYKLSERLAVGANFSAVISEGDFPYGDGLRRSNNDISRVRGGVDLFGILSGGEWTVKAYLNGSHRGTPGSTTYASEDRQNDRNAFVQGTLHQAFTPLYTLDLSGKAALDKMDYLSSWGDSRYDQREFQINSVHSFRVADWLGVSASAGVQHDALKSNVYNASRTGLSSSIAAAFRLKRFKADLALLYDGWFDKDGLSRNVLSPSASLKLTALEGLDIVAFGRRAYRAPYFNELYYTGYGNPALKAEDAWLTGLGAEWKRAFAGGWRSCVKLDGFYNILKDKIASAPTEADPNIWLPYNIGRVEAKGLDAQVALRYSAGGWEAGFSAGYSLQDALDRTEGSINRGRQIDYVPKHSVSLGADAAYRGWGLRLNWAGRSGRRDSYGELPAWSTLDLLAHKSFRIGRVGLIDLSVNAKNLGDTRYETVRYYPMPGRSLLAGIGFRF